CGPITLAIYPKPSLSFGFSESGLQSGSLHCLVDNGLVRRMAKLTDDVDYDAGETFEKVSSPLSDVGNHDNYYGRRLRTRCVLHGLPENKIKLRQRGQPTSINPKETATTPEATTSWSSYIQLTSIV
ncbi:unnamed protein product, partial [Protopolystoma xenopodis]